LTPISSYTEIGEVEGIAQLSDDFLVASNGSNKIFVLDCRNELNILKVINVEDFNEDEIHGLKDLVVVGEYIFAIKANNNRVIKINPKTGKVVRFYNMMNLIDFELKTNSLNNKDISQGASLSGITYDFNKKVFIITGKNWGHYYEVNLK
jgi:glutamine cyclotransferase